MTARLGVGAVVCEGDRILLIRRGKEPGAGRWSVPGGHVEEGETLEEAVCREVREETGLSVEAGSLVGFVEMALGSDRYVICDFLASPTGEGELRPGDDASEAVWVTRHAARELDLVEGLRDFLVAHGLL